MKQTEETAKRHSGDEVKHSPNASTLTLDIDQRIKLMEFAHEKTRLSGSWKDTYKEIVELITGVPINLPGGDLNLLKKIDAGEYHLSITPMSDIHVLSPEENDTLKKLYNGDLVCKIEPA